MGLRVEGGLPVKGGGTSAPLSHVLSSQYRVFDASSVSHNRPVDSDVQKKNLKRDRPSFLFSAHMVLRTELCVTTLSLL